MRIRSTIAVVEKELAAAGTPDRATAEKRYLKSDLEFFGVPVPRIRLLARGWLRANAEVPLSDVERLVRALWRRPVHESRSFGVELLAGHPERMTARDLDLVEWILRRANTWAHVDPVATRIAGPLVEAHPPLRQDLDRWSRDENLWLRRAALLAHLPQLRRGAGGWQDFVRHATPMLNDPEFFIRKAIGWVLREMAKVRPDRVASFLVSNLDRVSGLTLREAVKPLPAAERESLLAAFRERASSPTGEIQNR